MQREELLKLSETDPDMMIRTALEDPDAGWGVLAELMEAEEDEECQQQEQLFQAETARGEQIRAMVTIGLESLGFVRHARNPWTRSMTALPKKLSNRDDAAIRQEIHKLTGRCCKRRGRAVR